jgi:hypothetical protein
MKRVPKSKRIAAAALAVAIPVGLVFFAPSPSRPAPVSVKSGGEQAGTRSLRSGLLSEPVETIEWELVELVGYDANGEMVTMPLAYHRSTWHDLNPCPFDVNGDGAVDLDDIDGVLSHFGEGCD